MSASYSNSRIESKITDPLLFRYFVYVDGSSYSSATVSLTRARKGIMLNKVVYQTFDLFVIVNIIVPCGIE